MADVCCMSITFYCDIESKNSIEGLARLYKTIEKGIKKENSSSVLFSEVLPPETYKGCYNRGEFTYIADMENIKFSVDAETAYSPAYEYLNALCKAYGVHFASSSEECNGDCFEIYGDPNGEFYSYNFSIDIWGTSKPSEDGTPAISDAYEFFESEKEMLDWLNDEEHYGKLFHSDSSTEWEDFFDEHEAGHIRTWERCE